MNQPASFKNEETMKRFVIPESDETLLKQCTVYTFRAGGKGGQHVNKNETAVRLRHIESGITVSCQRERSQYLNKKICCERLRERLRVLNFTPKKRIPTKTPHRVIKKRKKQKYHQSQKKHNRMKVNFDAE